MREMLKSSSSKKKGKKRLGGDVLDSDRVYHHEVVALALDVGPVDEDPRVGLELGIGQRDVVPGKMLKSDSSEKRGKKRSHLTLPSLYKKKKVNLNLKSSSPLPSPSKKRTRFGYPSSPREGGEENEDLGPSLALVPMPTKKASMDQINDAPA